MTKRYFKATDGKRTVFRASATRVYASATMDGSFSAAPPRTGISYPAVELDKGPYDRLVALKNLRFSGSSRNAYLMNSPRESWIENADLPDGPPRREPTDTEIDDYIRRVGEADVAAGIA